MITRSQICDFSWDKLVEHSGQSVIYGFTFYLDLVCQDWKALVWPSKDHYEIVMPLPVRWKAGMLLVYQPLFCQYLGIFSGSDLTIFQAEAFLKALSAHFPYISAYHFNPDNYGLLKGFESQLKELEFKTNSTLWLDLQRDYKEIYNGYSKDRRANLKRGQKVGWEILKSSNIHPLIYLFAQNHAMKITGGVNPLVYNHLEVIFQTLKSFRCAELWYAHKDGAIHAGILVVRHGRRVIYLFNAADPVGRRKNARTFLLDQYYSAYAGNPLTFDFESPEIGSISRFYQSFGSMMVPYLKITKNQLWPPFRQLQNLRKRFGLKTR